MAIAPWTLQTFCIVHWSQHRFAESNSLTFGTDKSMHAADSTSSHFKYNIQRIRYREEQHDWQHNSAFQDYQIAHEPITTSTKQ